MSVRQYKRKLFELLRNHRFTRIVQDLDNYLTNVEVQEGAPPWKNEEILVLAPHPDDESIGCGGTLGLLSRAGNKIDALFLTEGAPPGDEATKLRRREEAKAAAAILGLRECLFLTGQDGDLHLQSWFSDDVLAQLKKRPYKAVFCPWPHDGHSDHAATFRIFAEALKSFPGSLEVWLYEVWSPVLANHVVDISTTIELKQKAIRAHSSQTSLIDYPDKFLALARYRSLICRPSSYAEAYLTGDRDTILALGSKALRKTR